MSPIIIVTRNVQLNTNIQSTSRESVTHVSQQGASVGAQSSCWAEWLSPSAECCLPLHLSHFHPIIVWSLPRLPLQRWTNDFDESRLKYLSKNLLFVFCIFSIPNIISFRFWLKIWTCIFFWPFSKAQYHCVTRSPLLYFMRSWVALSFKVCESVRHR